MSIIDITPINTVFFIENYNLLRFQYFEITGVVSFRWRFGEAYDDKYNSSTVKFGGGSEMVWGSKSISGTGMLFICDDRMNSNTHTRLLEQCYLNALEKTFNNIIPYGVIFQYDNKPWHA